jgi:ketosteroid isomerase-like protein
MRKVNFIVIPVASIIIMMSCNTGETKPEENSSVSHNVIELPAAKTLIDSVNQKFTEEVLSGDSVALASHYWPDAELMLDNSETVKGKDAIPAWGAMIRMGIKHFITQTTDITVSGNLLVETGNYELKTADNTLADRGKYVVVWQYRNGEWKLFRDIGCTSLPLPPAK